MGIGIAAGDDALHLGAAAAALLGAVFIQIGTNFANDYFDHAKGADTAERLGPTRATAAGQVAPGTMRRAFLLMFLLAFLCGLYLAYRAGWPVVWIGLPSLAFGVLYTGGPYPLAYVGIADVFVLAFFGPVAVAGTHYVQALEWSVPAVVAGLAPGLIAVALLTVNNLRDIETDRTAGKRTLAVRLGATYAKAQIVVSLLLAALLPVALWRYLDAPAGVLAASAVCALGIRPVADVVRARPGDRLLGALGGLGLLLLLFGVAFFLGWIL